MEKGTARSVGVSNFNIHHQDALLKKIGSQIGKSATQEALRRLIQRGITALPKSVTPSRIEENFGFFNLSLDDEQMARIRLMNNGEKLFIEPDNVDLGFPIR